MPPGGAGLGKGDQGGLQLLLKEEEEALGSAGISFGTPGSELLFLQHPRLSKLYFTSPTSACGL